MPDPCLSLLYIHMKMRQEGVEGMKKKFLLLITGLLVIFFLAACGSKSQDDVVKELNSKLNDLSGL